MTPKDFTNEQLIGWGGGDVFNQALMLAKRGQVLRADWDDATASATGLAPEVGAGPGPRVGGGGL